MFHINHLILVIYIDYQKWLAKLLLDIIRGNTQLLVFSYRCTTNRVLNYTLIFKIATETEQNVSKISQNIAETEHNVLFLRQLNLILWK